MVKNKKITKLEIIETSLILLTIIAISINIIPSNSNNFIKKSTGISTLETTKNYDADYINNYYSNEEISSIIDDLTARLSSLKNEVHSQKERDNNIKTSVNNITDKNNSDNVFLKTYPKDSIYISYNNTNPGTIFGGTWEAIGSGKVLTGMNTSDTNFASLGQTGGSKTISYTPNGTINNTTLTVANLPAHTHGSRSLTGAFEVRRFYSVGKDETGNGNIIIQTSGGIASQNSSTRWSGSHSVLNADNYSATNPKIDRFTINATHTHNSVGGGGAHNHPFTGTQSTINVLQSYVTVYMWRRTA